ncbi:hypothetical protein NEF87_003381 [Candidatus Lokiarchaeum ossiferum]|uniref:Uncharacterized protein n=1 Tax=Candidatus Lokiarchaeum ossiferum TaxID=2951803 RepID=A0ABY6HU97_9ARCH|nr:hypothetical protein NEF87_003381 [Candidatus Lokiarchaeum sp. B-35]
MQLKKKYSRLFLIYFVLSLELATIDANTESFPAFRESYNIENDDYILYEVKKNHDFDSFYQIRITDIQILDDSQFKLNLRHYTTKSYTDALDLKEFSIIKDENLTISNNQSSQASFFWIYPTTLQFQDFFSNISISDFQLEQKAENFWDINQSIIESENFRIDFLDNNETASLIYDLSTYTAGSTRFTYTILYKLKFNQTTGYISEFSEVYQKIRFCDGVTCNFETSVQSYYIKETSIKNIRSGTENSDKTRKINSFSFIGIISTMFVSTIILTKRKSNQKKRCL